jgi:uncharacterized membrane protein
VPEALRPIRLAAVLGAVVVTLSAGYLLKAPCLDSWADGRQYNRLCYSDPVALYAAGDRDRGLDEARFPYLQAENEYPVLSGVAMWKAAVLSRNHADFFHWTALTLSIAALATGWALHHLTGRRALYFAAAPALALYAYLNWDLLAVALATRATLAYLRHHRGWAGVLLGLGAAAKLYPALLVIPFAAGAWLEGRRRDAGGLVAGAAGAWLVVNVPFAVASFDRWSEFFRFNAVRTADWDSPWFLLQEGLGVRWPTSVVNLLAAGSFVLLAAVLWRAGRARGAPVWTFGFPLLVAFLITGKVFSPQFGLWLLPWFALTLPHLGLFVALQATEVAVFVTRFLFFARITGVGEGLPLEVFAVAVVLRTAVLVACLAAWARRPAPAEAPREAPAVEAAA